jgi:hypothetical protein
LGWRGPGGGDGQEDGVIPGRDGDGGGGGRGGGGVVPTAVKAGQTVWRRNEAPTWRRTWRRAHAGDVEEERAPTGVW